jgi:hypothetical protein
VVVEVVSTTTSSAAFLVDFLHPNEIDKSIEVIAANRSKRLRMGPPIWIS